VLTVLLGDGVGRVVVEVLLTLRASVAVTMSELVVQNTSVQFDAQAKSRNTVGAGVGHLHGCVTFDGAIELFAVACALNVNTGR
jgi:hypothetical protein